MLIRSLFVFVAVGAVCALPLPARATDVFAQLFPLTGEIRLVNREALPQPIIFYSISSDGGALDGSGAWKSISDVYDASGNGLIDPSSDWFKLSDDSLELAEGVFTGPGGNLPATRAISLGHIWNPDAVPFPDLVFDIRDPSDQLLDVTVELAIDGDYFTDQVVDDFDYDFWRAHFGSIGNLLADGNLDGVVDAADYVVWRHNYGLEVSLPPFGSGSGGSTPPFGAGGSVVPEPATQLLVLFAIGSFMFVAARRSAIARARALLVEPVATHRRAVRR